MLGNEETPGDPEELNEYFDIVEASLPNDLIAKIQKQVDTNHGDIHDLCTQGRYGKVADEGLDCFGETESPFLAAVTVGEQAKTEFNGLNDIYHTNLVGNTQKQTFAHGYVGLKAFANGEKTAISREKLRE
jgi:hypothetical protein